MIDRCEIDLVNERETAAEFGQGLRRISTVVKFLCVLRDGAGPGTMAGVLHPEVVIAPVVGVTPSQGYTGLDKAIDFLADARAQGVKIEPDAAELSIMDTGAVLGRGHVRISNRGAVDVCPATLVYEFREGMICSLKGQLDDSAD